MSEEPKFTVIIPAFNEEVLVAEAIRSVQAQTREDWRAIVVDDGSSDGTAEVVTAIAARDLRIQLLSKPNGGLAAARNSALALATTPLVSFLDSDDMWLPGYLDAMDAALAEDPGAGVAYTDAWALDTDSGRFRSASAMSTCNPPAVVPTDPVETMKLLVRQNFIWVSTTVRRRTLEDSGLFREDYRLTEDIELWFRVLAAGWHMVRPPGIFGIKRERAEALSRQDLNNVVSLQRVMRDVIANEKIPSDVKELAAGRISELERWRLALSGENRPLAVGLAARRRLGAMRRATIGRRSDWLDRPPADVMAAYPELHGS
jgi:glycosyltransferase involved in cell wall biosynthesis